MARPFVTAAIAAGLVAVAVGIGAGRFDPVYEAQTRVFVAPARLGDSPVPGLRIPPRFLQVPGTAGTSALTDHPPPLQAIAARAQRELPWLGAGEVLDHVEVEPYHPRSVLTFRARAGSARHAAALATAFAGAYTAYDDESFQRVLAGAPVPADPELRAVRHLALASLRGTAPRTFVVLSPARPPDSPATPRPVRDAVVAFLIVLLAAVAARAVRNASG